VEHGQRSIQTAKSVKKLAADLGVKKTYVVGNKIDSPGDEEFIRQSLPDFEVLGFLSADPNVREADLKGVSPYDVAPHAVAEAEKIVDLLEEIQGGGSGKENS